MSLFGGMFGGGQKHPNLDPLSQSIQNNLGLHIGPPGEDVFAVIDSMRCTLPLGQVISSSLIFFADPKPKCARLSLADR